MKRVVGHSDLSRDHWTGKSQWNFPPEDVYKKLQAAARGNAFKREYDDLKREFYATRAYFDNAHDNMTDVWDFPRVTGDDRHGHATPKPVTMIERAIKSSCSTGGVVYVPFGGTAPEIVACQNLNRKCRAVEISPAYCAVILQRMTDAFPGIDIERID
jgi:DNA modification methylase